MTGAVVPFSPAQAGEVMEQVLIRGDLASLTHAERARYYIRICESLGLNPMTKPFEYLTLNGKLTLYALKACTDQLRKIHGVSVVDLTESERDGVFIITAKVVDADGRADAAKGAVNIQGLKGDALANALMKAETKAKRRATLSLCGLGFLDETEIETIPESAMRPVEKVPARIQRNLDRLAPKPDSISERAIIARGVKSLTVTAAAKAINRRLHPFNDELPGDLGPAVESENPAAFLQAAE
jgi:hypothetical protein